MSTLSVSNITDGTDTVETGYVVNGSAKAWINFNGSGTVATRDSYNISSLTDNATGDYATSFTNSFANTNYVATFGNNSGSTYILNYYNDANVFTGSLRMYSYNTSIAVDVNIATCDIMGDLA
jgi:hypothetical protein